MKKKILILGSGGMVGHVVAMKLKDEFDVTTVSRTNEIAPPDILADVTDFDALRNIYLKQDPEVIINCVGILNHIAEDHPDQAILINGYLPHFLEALTKGQKCKVIHISTDCVFSGKRGGYKEDDQKDGEGFYAQSKAIGELLNDKDLTLRTSLIGPELKNNGIGLFHWFSRQKDTINGYTEVFWTGITSIEIANAIRSAIEQDIKGLYHLVSSEKISKYNLLHLFKKHFTNTGIAEIGPSAKFAYDKSLVNTRSDFNYAVPAYDDMIKEMKDWIMLHKKMYPHYANIL